MDHGENYVKSNPYSFLPPQVYQPPLNQVYGQLQPVGNMSDSMSRMITNGQQYNSIVPHHQDRNNGLADALSLLCLPEETTVPYLCCLSVSVIPENKYLEEVFKIPNDIYEALYPK